MSETERLLRLRRMDREEREKLDAERAARRVPPALPAEVRKSAAASARIHTRTILELRTLAEAALPQPELDRRRARLLADRPGAAHRSWRVPFVSRHDVPGSP